MPIVLSILMILFSPFMSSAEDTMKGYVQVTLEYKSMFTGKIQILDEVCRQSRSIECAQASIKVNGESCRNKPAPLECQDAQTLLNTSFCIEGLIYENRIVPGVKILLNLCASDAGYGNMSVRDIYKGIIWTNYSLLNDGQAVSFP